MCPSRPLSDSNAMFMIGVIGMPAAWIARVMVLMVVGILALLGEKASGRYTVLGEDPGMWA